MNRSPATLSRLSEPSHWLIGLLSDPKKCVTAREARARALHALA